MKLTKKKGNITIMALFAMVLFVGIAALIINFSFGWETVSRVQMAAEETAKVRAQAVDIPLKEQLAIIEVLHPTDFAYPEHEFPSGLTHDEIVTKIGHKTILQPNDPNYQLAVSKADTTSIDEGKNYLKNMLSTNAKRDQILKSAEFCIDIKPLPEQSEEISFSCTTAEGTKIDKTLTVSGLEDNEYIVFEDEESASELKQYVVNVVFVGLAYEFRPFYDQILSNYGAETTKKSLVTAIAYPQVDKCFSTFCTQ